MPGNNRRDCPMQAPPQTHCGARCNGGAGLHSFAPGEAVAAYVTRLLKQEFVCVSWLVRAAPGSLDAAMCLPGDLDPGAAHCYGALHREVDIVIIDEYIQQRMGAMPEEIGFRAHASPASLCSRRLPRHFARHGGAADGRGYAVAPCRFTQVDMITPFVHADALDFAFMCYGGVQKSTRHKSNLPPPGKWSLRSLKGMYGRRSWAT